jgi:hypothetical protein
MSRAVARALRAAHETSHRRTTSLAHAIIRAAAAHFVELQMCPSNGRL